MINDCAHGQHDQPLQNHRVIIMIINYYLLKIIIFIIIVIIIIIRMGLIMVNLTNPLQEVNMVTSPMLWSRPIPLGNDKDDDGDVICDDEDDGYDEHGEHSHLFDALVKMGNDDDDDADYPAHSHHDILPPRCDLVCN